MSNDFESTLRRTVSRWHLAITDAQAVAMRAHFDAMIEANRAVNLTRITDPTEAAVKHYADSLALVAWVRERGHPISRVLDVGTGAGFPAVPLAIAQPDWSLTAIDGTGKKISFVNRCVDAIGLNNLRGVHAHSTAWETEERFDLVTFRALAALPMALSRAARFVAPRGRLVAFQTAEAVPGPDGGGLRFEERYPYQLGVGDETIPRALLIWRTP